MVRHTLIDLNPVELKYYIDLNPGELKYYIDLNPVELKYYPFMISLNKCTASCNVLSPKICVPKEKKDIF